MAMEPAAISARPATTTRWLLSTAPEIPAASAKGTVSPSDIPITTSRTTLPAVKWRSMCGVCGMGPQLGMGLEVLYGAVGNFALAVVTQRGRRVFQWQPERALHLNSHFGRDVAQAAGAVQQQIKADNLEHARAVAPAAHVEVFDVHQLAHQFAAHPSLFGYFA